MPLIRPFRKASLALGLAKTTDRELLLGCYDALVHEIDMENNLGRPKWVRNFGSPTPPPLHTYEATLSEDHANYLVGYFTVHDYMTEHSDEFDFVISVHEKRQVKFDPLSIDHDIEEFEGPHVKVTMPHWPFPRFITSRVDRMIMINTLKNEAIERVSMDAVLKASGLEI